MNRRAGAQGIGRIDLIEDRLVGIKSRELYEAPGAVALITAHQELENCCLEREQHRIKRDIDKRWAELVYDAQWFSPGNPVPERLHRRHPEVRLRRDSHGSARWPRRRDRPSLRQLAVRLQPGHLRFRRQLRPEVLQRLHRHLWSAEPRGRSPRRQVRQRHRGPGEQRRVSIIRIHVVNRLDNGGERTVGTILTGKLSLSHICKEIWKNNDREHY